jgi:zinc transporter ZupT
MVVLPLALSLAAFTATFLGGLLALKMRNRLGVLSAFDAAAPVLGVLASLVIKPPEKVLILILAFFAGGFLYLGAGDLLPEAHEQNPPLPTVAAALAGFALILVVVRLTPG